MTPSMRASDADRGRTVTALQQEVGSGRLTLDEFSERAATAYRARTVDELDALTRDLPSSPPYPRATTHRALAPLVIVVLLVLLGVGALLALGGAVFAMSPMAGCGG